MKITKTLFGFLVLSIGLTVPAHAVPIFLQTSITGEISVLNDGSLTEANNLGARNNPVTINGVLFGSDESALSAGWTDGSGNFSYDNFNTDLEALLDELVYASGFGSLGFTLDGLTIGNSYRLQLLFSNDKNSTGNDIFVSLLGSDFSLKNWQPNAVNLIVRFTAEAETLFVGFDGPDNQPGRAVLNGYALHEVPEPSTLAILALGLIGLGARRFKK